jgi:hypothetical protein
MEKETDKNVEDFLNYDCLDLNMKRLHLCIIAVKLLLMEKCVLNKNCSSCKIK